MYIPNPTARLGEKIASDYLTKQGYKIIEKNFRKGYGEIDIIAIDKDTLVFIEVKTRTSKAFGTPLEQISFYKVKALKKTAIFYSKFHPKLPQALRIDAVSVVLDSFGNVVNIELVKNITS